MSTRITALVKERQDSKGNIAPIEGCNRRKAETRRRHACKVALVRDRMCLLQQHRILMPLGVISSRPIPACLEVQAGQEQSDSESGRR